MTIRGVTTAVFVCAAMAGVAQAQSGDVPITIVLSDYAADVAPALQVQSDGNGFYRNSKTLTAVIQPGGDWVLDSLNPAKSTRAIYLRFTQPVPGSGPGGSAPLPLPSGLYKARIISACS